MVITQIMFKLTIYWLAMIGVMLLSLLTYEKFNCERVLTSGYECRLLMIQTKIED